MTTKEDTGAWIEDSEKEKVGRIIIRCDKMEIITIIIIILQIN